MTAGLQKMKGGIKEEVFTVQQACEMLGLTALSFNPDESNDPLLISFLLIHFRGEEENEIKGRMKVMTRINNPEGD